MKLYHYIYKLKKYQLILLGILLPFLFSTIIAILLNLFHISDIADNEIVEFDTITAVLMITIGPFIETAIFQYFPLKMGDFFWKKFKYRYCIIILLSSIIFALIHPHKIGYFTAMLFSGLVWAFVCLIFIKKKYYPVLCVAISHAGYNFILMMIRLFSD